MLIWALLILHAILLSFLILFAVSFRAMLKNLPMTLNLLPVGIRPPGHFARYVFFVLRLTALTIGLHT